MFPPTTNIQPSRSPWSTAVWHAVDRVVAFATLDAYGVEPPRAAVSGTGEHQDRAPLQTPRRPRRPAPAPRVQHCDSSLQLTLPRRRMPADHERTSPAPGFGVC